MDAGKEQTILEIANDTRRLLNVLEGGLDRVLRRGIGKEKGSGVRPQNPSIVEEIIDLMNGNNEMLADLSEQIRLKVFVKLDRLDKPDAGAS